MTYVPGCRYDLFISYDTENNRDSWVEQFQQALGAELGDLLGRQFDRKRSIFFDKRQLEVAQSFTEQLDEAARDSAILVPILSPGYATSPNWCGREYRQFFTKLPDGADGKSCLAPILLRPLSKDLEEGLPQLLRDAECVSFLSTDGQTPVPTGSPEWIAQLRKFAAKLRNALHQLRGSCKPVFVGMTGPAERAQTLRAWCRSELERRHFQTVPETITPDLDLVREYLQKAGLALHFLGGVDEDVLTAIEDSPSACKGPTILYQPFGANLTPEEKEWLQFFEEQLQTDPGHYQRLEGKSEQELLAILDEQITRSRASPAPARQTLDIALVCEEIDLAGVRQMRDEVRAQDPSIQVDFPQFLGTRLKAMECLRKLQEFLKCGENLIFYYGSAERERLESKWRIAEQYQPKSLHWFAAGPDLEGKRKRHPDDLWDVNQVIGLMKRTRSAGQS